MHVTLDIALRLAGLVLATGLVGLGLFFMVKKSDEPGRMLGKIAFSALLVAALAVLLWQRRRVRLSDWLLFAVFAAMALTAYRNIVLVGFFAPLVIASYVDWKRPLPAFAPRLAASALAAALLVGILSGGFFQLRAAQWRYPAGAAAFVRSHPAGGRLFNTYENGGYLIWQLAPDRPVFIDGRALSENLFADYGRILYDYQGASHPLLGRYGTGTLILNGFEYATGTLYPLAPILADPTQTEWKLVYSDAQAMVLMRQPPAGVPALDPSLVWAHLEQECGLHIEREPRYPRCALSLAQAFAKLHDFASARRWLGLYLDNWHQPDPEAEQAYRYYLGIGR